MPETAMRMQPPRKYDALRRLSYLYQTTRRYLNLLSFSALPFAVSQLRVSSATTDSWRFHVCAGTRRRSLLISQKGGSDCLRSEIAASRIALRPRNVFYERDPLEKDSEPEAPKFSSNRCYNRKRNRKKFHGK